MNHSRRVFLSSAAGVAAGARMAAASVQGANNRVRVPDRHRQPRARADGPAQAAPRRRDDGVCDVFEQRCCRPRRSPVRQRSRRRSTPHSRRPRDRRGGDRDAGSLAQDDDARRDRGGQGRLLRSRCRTRSRKAPTWSVPSRRRSRSCRPARSSAAGRTGWSARESWSRQARADHVRAHLLVSARPRGPMSRRRVPDRLDWKRWLGPAQDQPFRPERFFQWRHFWDFGGGCLTDLMTHWIDVVQWYMRRSKRRCPRSPRAATTTSNRGKRRTGSDDAGVPEQLHVAYLGTYVSQVDDGGLEFRGDLGTLKIDRTRLAFYKDDSAYVHGT